MEYDEKRIRTLLHYEQISRLNPNFKLTEEQQEYLNGYKAKMAETALAEEELHSEPFQLVEVSADGEQEVSEDAVLATPKTRSRKKKTSEDEAIEVLEAEKEESE